MSGKHWLSDRTVVSVPVTPVVRHCESKDFECHWAEGAFILITILCIFSHKVGSRLHGLLNTLFRLHKILRISPKNPIWHKGTWPTFTDLWQLRICYEEIILMPKGQSWLKHSKTYIVTTKALCARSSETQINDYLKNHRASEIFAKKIPNFKKLFYLPAIYYLIVFCITKT